MGIHYACTNAVFAGQRVWTIKFTNRMIKNTFGLGFQCQLTAELEIILAEFAWLLKLCYTLKRTRGEVNARDMQEVDKYKKQEK